MGLLTSALGGAGEGLEKGSNLAGGLYIKGSIEAEHQRLAQEAQAEREARNIQLTAEQARQTAAAAPRVIPAGATERVPGGEDYTAPTKETPEQAQERVARQGYLAALKNRYDAEAEAIRNGERYKAQEEKEPKKNLIKSEIDDGQGGKIPVFIDPATREVGVMYPGTPGKEAVTHWYKPDEPAVPARGPSMQWYTESGMPVAPGTPGAAPAATAPSTRPPLSSFLARSATQTPAATRTQRVSMDTQPPAPSAPIEAGNGPAVDLAKQKLSAATAKLQSYGLRQRQADPQGFAAAQQAKDFAQREYDSALAQYQNELGPVGAARFRPR